MEEIGKVFTQLYIILGICASMYLLIYGYLDLRREVQNIRFSSQRVILLLAFIVIVVAVVIMFWAATISYAF
ncbi:MAG: hypothetical protein ACD_25C00177G0002 [uncultured bacterium]|uniref:Uncharacterized protein n=2 Tax=Katanobacteria TaxID=422282 RepID=A0A0G1EHN9_UNCKA|nr:MAG: hypothetical protein ACD_25C00177G0002 [uncultured bacterium]KKT09348.1 MAG: hypothetical protein UV89_C0038G0003 [candidate division WWE3 bacterium GW2011_GWB2_43_22]OGC58748.1 MAG: hypothetical protein A2245_03155 [candidate division WWE3 bacterium RIFOXYA2_FULL_43_12]OGC65483.1 MAG: hypothetical protein A2274_00555 [candidate division WWE3 bacterium RIFOXYA12_FULL_43_11]OGC74119.1 MAG: hypothetical protein A2473_00515 [candidate division WWE3 bacterium RIFOXYC2_FULL_42_13]OGC75725.1